MEELATIYIVAPELSSIRLEVEFQQLEHHRKTQHRVVYQGCDNKEGITWVSGSQEYLDHLKEQNVCKTCEEHFKSPSNLDHVSREFVPFKVDVDTGSSIKWCIWNDRLNATAVTEDSVPIPQ